MIILVNGVPQITLINSHYPLTHMNVPVEAIDRIEMIRGPMSVIYGNGAFYGVINIFTNDLFNENISIASASFGSLSTKKLMLRTANQEKGFNYALNASIYDTVGPNYALNEMSTQDPDFPPGDETTRHKLEDNQRYLNFSGSFQNLYFNVSYNENKKEFYFTLPSASPGTYLHDVTLHLALGYRKEFSKNAFMEGRIIYTRNRDWYRYSPLFTGFYGIQNMEANGIEAELNGFFKVAPRVNVTAGFFYRSILDAFNMYSLPSFGIPALEDNYFFLAEDDNIDTRAVYTQVNYSPFDSLRLVAGLRLEQTPAYKLGRIQKISGFKPVMGIYNHDDIEVIPRLAAIFYLDEKNIFKFLFGKAINLPSFDQNRQNSIDQLHPDLEPEIIRSYEINYISEIFPRLTLNASVFLNTLENLITRIVEVKPDNTYQTWSGNAGKMQTRGMEITVNAEPIDNFRLELSGSFQETKDKRDAYKNIEVANSPKFLGYLKASYVAHKFSISLTGNYVDEMESYWDETIKNPDNTFGNRVGDRVKAYLLLSSNIRINDLFLDGLYLNFKCSNLFDKKFFYPAFTNNSWLDKGTIGIGRTFLLTLGYRF